MAKYAERKAALKKAALADAEGNIDYEALAKLRKLPRTLRACVCTTVAKSLAVRKAICANSASRVYSSVRWLPQV